MEAGNFKGLETLASILRVRMQGKTFWPSKVSSEETIFASKVVMALLHPYNGVKRYLLKPSSFIAHPFHSTVKHNEL